MMQKPAAASGIWVWSTVFGGFQLTTVWQASQFWLVGGWVGPSPCASVPLWQFAQLPMTCVWSKWTSGRNEIVLWQAAQRFVLGTCVAVFGVALNCEPVMWQVPQ